MTWLARNEAPVAAGLILVAVVCGWLIMPHLMLAISGGGKILGALVAVLFMLAFFGVFWLRARHQRRMGNK